LKQVETAEIAGTVTTSGNMSVTVTGAPLTGGVPYPFSVAVLNGDTASVVATKIRAKMNTLGVITALYTIGGEDEYVILTRKVEAANDTTLNISYANITSAGLIPDATSENTRAGATSLPIVTTDLLTFNDKNKLYFAFFVEQKDPAMSEPSARGFSFKVFESVSTVASDTEFEWTSPAYQLLVTGKQALKAIHFSYNCPVDAEINISVSYTVDEDDFITIATLHKSVLKQNSRQSISVRNAKMSDWMRVKITGHGDVQIYNMTMEWRLLDRLQ
jgi:hypothetical protein